MMIYFWKVSATLLLAGILGHCVAFYLPLRKTTTRSFDNHNNIPLLGVQQLYLRRTFAMISSESTGWESPLTGSRNFFSENESIVPSRFNNMHQWLELRDFLSSFGAKYKNRDEFENGVYKERRHYAHKIALRMSSIEKDYGTIEDEGSINIGVTIRLFCEAALAFFAPKEGWPRERFTIGEQLGYLRNKWGESHPEFGLFLDSCERLNTISKQDLHEHMTACGVTMHNKAGVVDDVFLAALFVQAGLKKLFPDDAERATILAKKLTFATQQTVWDGSGSDATLPADDKLDTVVEAVDNDIEAERKWMVEQEMKLEAEGAKRLVQIGEDIRAERALRMQALDQELLQKERQLESEHKAWLDAERQNLQNQMTIKVRRLKLEREQKLQQTASGLQTGTETAGNMAATTPSIPASSSKGDKKAAQREEMKMKEKKRQERLGDKKAKRKEKGKLEMKNEMQKQEWRAKMADPFGILDTLSRIGLDSYDLNAVEGPWEAMAASVGAEMNRFWEFLKDSGVESEDVTADELVSKIVDGIVHEGRIPTQDMVMNLAHALYNLNNEENAKLLLDGALAGYKARYGEDHPDYLIAVWTAARELTNWGQKHDSNEMFKVALDDYKRALGPDHKDTYSVMRDAGLVRWNLGLQREAIPMLESALTGFEKILGDSADEIRSVRHALSRMYLALGDEEKAKSYYDESESDN